MIQELRLLHWPAEDRASFAHFTTVMADVQARIHAISGDGAGVPVPRPPREPTARECAMLQLQHRRDMRDMAGADGDLFGDPAWEIALAVFQSEERLSDVAVLDMAGLSATGLAGARWIDMLLARGWLARNGEGYLYASDKMIAILERFFGRM